MKKLGKKDAHLPAKISAWVGLRTVQEMEMTKRQQIQHRTLQALIWAIALSPESAKAILLTVVSRWM